MLRIVRDEAHAAAVEPRQTDRHVPREARLELEELAIVGDARDDHPHVVWLAQILGDDVGEVVRAPRGGVVRTAPRHVGVEARREVPEQRADALEALAVVRRDDVRAAGELAVHLRAAEIFGRYLLSEHLLDDRGTGDEHLARTADHEDDIGQGWRVRADADARAHHRRELRHRAGGLAVRVEDAADRARDLEPLLDARAGGVPEPDDRQSERPRPVDRVRDLLAVGGAHGAGHDAPVLRVDVDRAALDAAVADDDAVPGPAPLGHTEVGDVRERLGELLHERAAVAERLDTLACRELRLGHYTIPSPARTASITDAAMIEPSWPPVFAAMAGMSR